MPYIYIGAVIINLIAATHTWSANKTIGQLFLASAFVPMLNIGTAMIYLSLFLKK